MRRSRTNRCALLLSPLPAKRDGERGNKIIKYSGRLPRAATALSAWAGHVAARVRDLGCGGAAADGQRLYGRRGEQPDHQGRAASALAILSTRHDLPVQWLFQ